MTERNMSLRERLRDESGLGLIEVVTAMIILSIGMLAIAGISLQVGTQNKLSTFQTDQSLAAQQVMEDMQRAGYATASNQTVSVSVGNRTYSVQAVVTTPAPRVKLVQLTVTGTNGVAPRTFANRIYETRQLPAAP